MNDPQRQHYVPIMLLKHFTDEDGWLHVFGRRFTTNKVLRMKPKQAFVVKHLHTVYDLEGHKDYSNERILSRIEGAAGPVVKKMISAVRELERPQLTHEEKEVWNRFFTCQWFRSPDAYPPPDIEDEMFEESVRDYFRDNSEAIEHVLSSDDLPKMIKHNAKAGMGLSADRSSAFEIVRRSGIRFAVIKNPRRSFVIGSDSLAKVIPRGFASLSNPDSYQWLPIAHDIAVTFASNSGHGESVETVDGQFVRTVNRATFSQSTQIAGRSRELVASLARSG